VTAPNSKGTRSASKKGQGVRPGLRELYYRELPEGGKDRVACKGTAVVPFIVGKGMALADRMKEEDAPGILIFALLNIQEESMGWSGSFKSIWTMVLLERV